MNGAVKWKLIYGTRAYEFLLPEVVDSFTFGNRPECDFQVPEWPGGCTVTVTMTGDGYSVKCTDRLGINRDDGKSSDETFDIPGRFMVGLPNAARVYVESDIAEYSDIPAMDRTIILKNDKILCGGTDSCSIRFKQPGQPCVAFSIENKNGKLVLCGGKAALGVYVNGRRLNIFENVILSNGDFISTANESFIYRSGTLQTSMDVAVSGMVYNDGSDQNSHLVYPKMTRTTRMHETAPKGSLEVLDPPAMPEREERNIILSILPTLIMLVLTIVIRMNADSGSMTMVIFSAVSMGVGMVGSILTYIETGKKIGEKARLREEKYTEYISKRTEEIENIRTSERECLQRIYKTPQTELRDIRIFSPELFDRTRSDTDFLDLRLGYGLLPSRQPIHRSEHKVFEKTDDLFLEPERLEKKFAYNDGLPAVIGLKDADAIAFQGATANQKQMIDLTILDLIVRQHPTDIQLYFFSTEEYADTANGWRLLPHINDKANLSRNIATDSASTEKLLEKLYKEMSFRSSVPAYAAQAPWLVIYVCSSETFLNHPIIQYVQGAAKLHAVFLFWAQHREQLPLGCRYFVRLFSNVSSAQLIDLYDGSFDRLFSYEPLDEGTVEEVARKLAPVYAGESDLAAELVHSCTFYDIPGIGGANAGQVLENWRSADTCKSMAAPIGVVSGGAPISLDIHEKVHGPHGLVAGTTGSGKSELLITYAISMAYRFSPRDITFLVIDFKGNGLAGPLSGLPHLIGTITNLEQSAVERSMISMRAESVRRQRAFSNAKVKDINDYTKAFREGRVSMPIPHLIILVDEFAELKAQFPEFMDELISLSRIGRSLGMHLILATQKPAGVINDQIWSNSDFQLCLRVQTQSDSNDVIHSPLAAEIRDPGRGYLKVERCELFTLFQSGYSGAPAIKIAEQDKPFKVDRVLLNGDRALFYERKAKVSPDGKKPATQLTAISDTVTNVFTEINESKPAMLCLPALEKNIPFADSDIGGRYVLPVGICDLPAEQTQIPIGFNLLGGNILIAGSSRSGKTNVLQTLLKGAAERFTARELQVYVLDFNTGIFKTMEKLSIVGGVATKDQGERVKNLIKVLHGETEYRREHLPEANCITMQGYIEAGHTDIPVILVLIDNYDAFHEIYGDELEDEMTALMRDSAGNGIIFCATTSQPGRMGMRRISAFSQRTAMFFQERSEYSMILDGCRRTLPQIPGRTVWCVGKEFAEAQTYHAFTGTSDAERTQNCLEFVQAHSQAPFARAIPEVPPMLTEAALSEMFPLSENNLFRLGMSYRDVEPVAIDVASQFSLALVGKNERTRDMLLERIMRFLTRRGACRMYLADHYNRNLASYEHNENTAEYTMETSKAMQFIFDLQKEAVRRMDIVRSSGMSALSDEPLLVCVINTRDVINAISNDSKCMNAYKDLRDNYHRMKILFIFSDIENKPVKYGSPELLRSLREERKAVLFEALSTDKTFEIDGMTVRENKSPLGNDDAFYFDESDTVRVKLIREG